MHKLKPLKLTKQNDPRYVSQLQVEDEQGVNVCTESSLTLRRLLVWMYDPKVRLKTLAALVDFCQGGLGVDV